MDAMEGHILSHCLIPELRALVRVDAVNDVARERFMFAADLRQQLHDLLWSLTFAFK